jgi:histidine triad (HIT) family protein
MFSFRMKCVFCEIVAGRSPASVIYDDDVVLAFMSLQPSQPGECLIIPKQHIDHFTDIPDDLTAHLSIIAQKIGRKMREVLSPQRVGRLYMVLVSHTRI